MVFVIKVEGLQRPEVEKELNKIKEPLSRGSIVVFPTDTVYGIGCDVFNESSVKKIFEIKKRDFSKPLPILLSNKNIAFRIAKIPRIARLLISHFWPGALTLVVYPRIRFSNYFLDEKGKVAIRLPNNFIARKVAKLLKGMVVGTSANLSGAPPAATAKQAISQLKDVDFVIDAGRTKTTPSTVVEVEKDGVILVREGAVPFDKVDSLLRKFF